MSTSHHGADDVATQRLVNEIFGRAKMRWPNGQVDPTDQGETAFGIAADPQANIIRIHFTKPILWLGLGRQEAVRLRDMLTEKIAELK